MIRERLSGNEAVAFAMKQINPDVVPAYPITPSTEIPQYFSSFVSNGTVDTEFIPVESEHSALSACIGASAAGGRVMSATSSQGLSLMYEMLYIASGMRLPIVLTCVNRAVSAPINIHNDHSDSMGVRDCGFIQLYCESNQEAYDNIIMAVKIAERSMIPVMVCYDGFITSHSVENIELLEDSVVKDFVGKYEPKHYLLNPNEFISMGPLDLQNYFFEHRKQLADAMTDSKKIIEEVSEEFAKISGRKYGMFESYKTEDSDACMVILNSSAGTAKVVVDKLREEGLKVGILKPRVFRPLPYKDLTNALRNQKAIAIMDKADSVNGFSGPLYSELSAALYSQSISIPSINYIYGLGGRDVKETDLEEVFRNIIKISKDGKVDKTTNYLGVRE
ncbi:MAG: pyruvate ferredoxin oxidoreductase [Clostridia bacterium]|nr:pyruvate ferredoxin oxidoreductase [Clostridia bacterium]MDD4375512.1 pyruvate ferredoxin oxidoreductase [Clostridia bacterium]